MKQLVLLLCAYVLSTAAFSQSVFRKSALTRNAAYAYYVIDAEKGDVIAETPQISLVPASVMKIVTTSAALEILGADYRFHTLLGITGKVNSENGLLDGDLVLRGGCDPAFYSEYFTEHYKGTFETWAQSLSDAGISRIGGDFIVDLSQMQGPPVPGGWLWGDIGNYYGTGVSALTYLDNSYKIHFSSSATPGRPVKINYISPAIDSFLLTNKVRSSNINSDRAYIYGAPGSFTHLVEGTIPKGRTDFVVKGAMPEPARIAANEFVKVLKSFNIEITGKIRFMNEMTGVPFALIADKASPALKELIVPLNRESINLYAEHLFREIGRAMKGSALPDSGITAINEYWKEKRIFTDGFYPTDGSGLSRSNGICTRTLAEILRYMYLSPYRDDFFNSLPVAGRSGTLQNSLTGTKLENNLRAKTGSMNRVRSMAGIFTTKKGRKVIFAVIVNNFMGSQAAAGKLTEDFLIEVYNLNPPEIKRDVNPG